MFSWTRTVLRKRVIVNLDTGRAFRGVAWAKRGRLLVLRDVTVLEPGSDPLPADGEIVVERARVEFIQALGAGKP